MIGFSHECPGGFGELMLERHVLVFARMHLGHDLVPEHARLHDVALFHRGHLVAALARQIEGDAGDALDLVGLVDLRVDAALLAVAKIGDGLGFAEIDATRQLTDDQDVEALDQFTFQARSLGQRRIADRRPQVGEQVQFLAQPQDGDFGAAFGTIASR